MNQNSRNVAARISTGTGTPATTPCPMNLNDGDRPAIGMPSLKMKVRPRATLNMPSVTTNDGKPRRATMAPLTMPSASPTPNPASSATPKPSPLPPVTKLAATMPDTASSEPTDRSMPLVRMT